uniref:Mucin-5AC n=1 Tax=Phallusia mammillata TaxID=59560 RepID=A0A6F9DKW4_9ASCI|nr:mucin-5AC [Phallusia mammillata]
MQGCEDGLVMGEDEDRMLGVKLIRGPGLFGEVKVQWRLTPTDVNTFHNVQGEALFENLQNETTIVIETIDDNIPEVTQEYNLQIVAATGGAEIDASLNTCRVTVTSSDSPHGTFQFSQPVYHVKETDGMSHDNIHQSVTDTSSFAKVTVIRNNGHMGEVEVFVQTSPGSATPNVDYYPVNKKLLFTNAEKFKDINIEIIDDNVPEGPNDFHVNITDVTFLTSDLLPHDSPPKLGDVTRSLVRIAKSDGAEGSVEFRDEMMEVDEDAGIARVVLVRNGGSYGSISVTLNSLNQTARRNFDFLLPSDGFIVEFKDDQQVAEASIRIVDDDEMEEEEKFTLIISDVAGGARMGGRLLTEVVIRKSDFPNGLLEFVGDNHVTVANPGVSDGPTQLKFYIERRGGNRLLVAARWRVSRTSPYISPTTSASALEPDIARPYTGTFNFADNEGGQKEITVTVLPHGGAEEVEENFMISVEGFYPAELSRTKGNVTIVVAKKGHPNGVVKFADSAENMETNEPSSGLSQLVFPLKRTQGTVGDVNVTWVVRPINAEFGASLDDVDKSTGLVQIYAGQSDAELIVNINEDLIPEIDEKFQVRLDGVIGGAELDTNNIVKEFTINANDDPHGVFGVFPSDQLVRVDDNMKRLLQVNVTRQKGTFGQVVVGFKIKFDVPDSGMSYLTTNTGTVTFTTATKWAVEEISIRSSANLQVGDMFVIELTSVELLDGDSAKILPSILTQFSKTFVEVPPQAGNPQMGFDPTISHVTDVSRDMCKVRLLRTGLFGPVTVHWASGYPMRREPEGFTHGRTLPSSGVVTMDNLQEEADISVRVLPSNDHRNLFAIHITRVHSSLPGGASMLSHRDVAEIDPCGAVRFADFSQRVTVTGQQLNLTVERLYGSRYDIIIHYVITPLTAHPGVDYVPSDDDVITMKSGEVEANIDVTLMTSSVPQLSKQFIVNLTMTSQPQDIYAGLSPRIIESERVSHVTIAESRDARGVISFDDFTIETNESGRDGGQVHVLMLNIRREVGLFGDVSVMVSSFGEGETLDMGVQDSTAPYSGYIKRRIQTDRTKQASAGLDYEVRPINVTIQDGQSEATIPVVVLDDEMSEPDEAFFLYLHSATGGARVDDVNGIVKILIQANDLPNGKIGFESENFVLDEDSPSRSVDLKLVRSHAFGDVTVHWRAVESLPTGDDNPTTIPTVTSSVHHHDAKMLNEQIEVTSGDVTCHEGQFDCYITITMKHDELAEFSDFFFVVLEEVSYGAEIDETRSVANLAILDSDSPHGKFLFTLSSRLPVVTKGTKSVGLTVQRSGGDSTVTSLRYSTRQLRRVVTVAGVTLYPAVEDVDYKQKDGSVEFEAGQREAYLTFDLVTESASTNPLPQIFQVVLDWSSGSSEISDVYHVANVTIVRSDESKKVWGVYEALQQDLDDSVVQGILTQLNNFAEENLNGEQLSIFHGCLDRIINEGRTRRLPQAILQQIYELFCKLLDPYRLDAVHGYSPFSSSFDEFALCLTSQSDCVSDDVTARSMTSCSHVMVQSFRSFPELINGYSFQGGGGNFFKLPIDLLDVNQHGVDGRNPKCFDVYFVEYSSQLWFEVNGGKGAMSNKIFSVGVDGKNIHTLTSPVKYRVYTKDLRISPKGAECVLWNEASSRWLLDPRDLCQVVDDDSNFVECECRHMSVYAARGPTDNLAGYNEATYAACFIAMVGSLLTVLGHHLCSKKSTFAAKLMMHMYFACAMTQLMFVIGALTSNQLSEESCAALAIFLHYFWLAQFTWIFMQSINILQVLAFNNENTDRLYILHFTLGWGIPSIVILLYVIIMYALGSKSLFHSYGDVHQNGDMCMIMNIYGVLLGAVTPAALCLVVTIAVGVVLYQRDVGWKQFDDLFRGRYNSVEIPLLFLSFFLIAFTWLWGGIHLAFGHMWALVLFIVSNFIQGFYFLIAYGLLHNEAVRPTKAVYQETPIKNAQGPQHVTYAGSATYGSQPPSVSGDVHNKSTQSIAQHFEKGGWENPGLEVGDESLDEDGEDAEFDDLMFALNNSARVGLDDIEETRLASNPPSVGNRSVSSQNSVSNELSRPVPNTTNTKSLPIHDTHL